MSLHALATDMASKGRNGDSMLVHMTPGEVHGLQALAMKHGGSLTINPDTGLPEANFLKSLLPMLAGFALGPAGFGLVSSAMGAGALVGGITGIATGSLSKGLMAGLGAYGGFGIGESLAGLGAGELAQGQISANMPTLAEGASQAQIADYAKQVNDLRTAGLQGASQLPMADKLSAGFSSATASPMDAFNFAKDNKMALGMAAAPIVADMMVPTTTKMAPVQSPGRIREKRWDGRQFVDVASTDAGVYNTSGRNFSDLYRGYNSGGIVALAEGGVPGYAGNTGSVVGGSVITPDDAYRLFTQARNTAAIQPGGALDFGPNGVASQASVDRSNAYQTQAGNAALANLGYGMDQTGNITGTGKAITPDDLYKLYTQARHTAAIQPGGALDFGTTGIASLDSVGKSNAYQAQAGNAVLANYGYEMDRYGNIVPIGTATATETAPVTTNTGTTTDTTTGATTGATGPVVCGPGYKLSIDGKTCVPDTTVITQETSCPSGQHYDPVLKACVPNVSATQNTTTNVTTPTDIATASKTALPVGVGGAGVTTINPNGTVSTSPDLTLGMKEVRDDYVRGGGNLGYTSPVPKSLDAFTEQYVNKRMGGDSLDAYNYLTGKAGAVYPTKSGFAGQLSQDYATAVLGYPARGNLPYIYNKVTGRMDPNPDYVAPGRDAEGNVTYSMSLNDIKSSLKDTPLSGQALYDWAKSNNLSAQQIADATGRSLSSVYADFRAGSKAAATKDKTVAAGTNTVAVGGTNYDITDQTAQPPEDNNGPWSWDVSTKKWVQYGRYAEGGMTGYSLGGLGSLGGYSDGGRLLKGPGDGVSDSIPATIGRKQQPARLADGEFVVPARIVSELGNGSTDAGAKKLYAMMDRVQRARGKTTGKNKVAANSRADKYLPA